MIIAEEIAATGTQGLALGLHNDVVAPYLIELTTDEQRRRWLPRFVTGELLVAIAMSEPGAGSDLGRITSSARRDGDHYLLNWEASENHIKINGRVPVNPHGGSLAEGGSQGAGHVREAVTQLRGQAGQRQVPGAMAALLTPGGFFFNAQGLVLRNL